MGTRAHPEQVGQVPKRRMSQGDDEVVGLPRLGKAGKDEGLDEVGMQDEIHNETDSTLTMGSRRKDREWPGSLEETDEATGRSMTVVVVGQGEGESVSADGSAEGSLAGGRRRRLGG